MELICELLTAGTYVRFLYYGSLLIAVFYSFLAHAYTANRKHVELSPFSFRDIASLTSLLAFCTWPDISAVVLLPASLPPVYRLS